MNKTIFPIIETYPEEAVRDGLYDPYKRSILLKHVAAEMTVRAALELPDIKPLFIGVVLQEPNIADLLGEWDEDSFILAERGQPLDLSSVEIWKATHEDAVWTHVADKLFPMEA